MLQCVPLSLQFDVNPAPLYIAAQQGKLEAARLLLQHGANVNQASETVSILATLCQLITTTHCSLDSVKSSNYTMPSRCAEVHDVHYRPASACCIKQLPFIMDPSSTQLPLVKHMQCQ